MLYRVWPNPANNARLHRNIQYVQVKLHQVMYTAAVLFFPVCSHIPALVINVGFGHILRGPRNYLAAQHINPLTGALYRRVFPDTCSDVPLFKVVNLNRLIAHTSPHAFR